MTKTPEQMAEEYANTTDSCDVDQEYAFAYNGFLAGYQAAKDEIEAYKDGAKDVAKKLKELIAEQDQLADADKVMPEWISVKEVIINGKTYRLVEP